MPKFIGYAATGITYTPRNNSWSLQAGFDRARDCVLFEASGGEAGALHHSIRAWDLNGAMIADGLAGSGEYYEAEGPGGEAIYIDRIEVDGRDIGYTASSPLQQGVGYTHFKTYNEELDSTSCLRPTGAPGFGPNTRVATDVGDIPVAWLVRGAKVLTRDKGLQPLRWLGRTQMPALTMRCIPDCAPVRVQAQFVDPDAAEGFLDLSPEHRIMVQGADVQRLFGKDEVSVLAKYLADPQKPATRNRSYTFHHLLFASHQVVRANGVWSESLFAAPTDPAPELDGGMSPPCGVFHAHEARPCLTQEQTAMLLRVRHQQVRTAAGLFA